MWQCMRVLAVLHPCQLLSVFSLFNFVFLIKCIVVYYYGLIYISLMTNDVDNFVMYLLNIYIFSFVKYLVKFVVHLFLLCLINEF